MKATSLESRLLSVYRAAVHQKNWIVADHLLSAIEACAPPDATMSATAVNAMIQVGRVVIVLLRLFN